MVEAVEFGRVGKIEKDMADEFVNQRGGSEGKKGVENGGNLDGEVANIHRNRVDEGIKELVGVGDGIGSSSVGDGPEFDADDEKEGENGNNNISQPRFNLRKQSNNYVNDDTDDGNHHQNHHHNNNSLTSNGEVAGENVPSESELPSYIELEQMEEKSNSLPGYSKPTDTLPSYSATLPYNGVCLMKTEFISPYHSNPSRNWQPVYLELNSTQLRIYKINDKSILKIIKLLYFENNGLTKLMNQVNSNQVKSDSDENEDVYQESIKSFNFKAKFQFNNDRKLQKLLSKHYNSFKSNQMLFEPTNNLQENFKYKGELLHCYTLNNMSIGEAPSLNHLISAIYKEDHSHYNIVNLVKYKNVLRVRIEMNQILLQFWSFNSMIHWYRNLLMGKDLSVPLETRNLSKLKSIPSRYSRRNNELLAATAAACLFNLNANANLMQQQNISNLINLSNSNHEKDSDSDSVFTRRQSVSTYASTIEDLSEISIMGYKFYSRENLLTTVEKQYISNCIPDLNSFDSWCGKVLTISNYEKFVTNKDPTNDIFINYNSLPKLIMNYKQKQDSKCCHQFLIHQSGLFGLPKA